MLQNEGKRMEAETIYRQALTLGRREDSGGLWQASTLLGLATLLAPRDPAAAAGLSRQRYELFLTHYGQEDGRTAIAKILWVRQRADAGESKQAAPQVLEAIEVVRKQFSPSSMDRWFALSSSAHVLNQAGLYREAESVAREMLPILDLNRLPDNDGRRGESLFEVGKALHGEGKNREAAEALKKAAAICDSSGSNGAVMARWVREVLQEID